MLTASMFNDSQIAAAFKVAFYNSTASYTADNAAHDMCGALVSEEMCSKSVTSGVCFTHTCSCVWSCTLVCHAQAYFGVVIVAVAAVAPGQRRNPVSALLRLGC